MLLRNPPDKAHEDSLEERLPRVPSVNRVCHYWPPSVDDKKSMSHLVALIILVPSERVILLM